jgi:hypothetical protein
MDANQTKVDGIEDEMLVRMREDLNVVWQKWDPYLTNGLWTWSVAEDR